MAQIQLVPPNLHEVRLMLFTSDQGDIGAQGGIQKGHTDTYRFRIAGAASYADPSLNNAVRDDELTAEVVFPVSALAPAAPERQRYVASSRIRHEQRLASNYYVFCLSTALEHRLLLDFESDCCLVVHETDEFTRRLTLAMGEAAPGWHMRHREISYYDPLQCMPRQVTLPFSKHFRYAYQREFRFVWLPGSQRATLDPVLVELGDLTSIAELVFPS